LHDCGSHSGVAEDSLFGGDVLTCWLETLCSSEMSVYLLTQHNSPEDLNICCTFVTWDHKTQKMLMSYFVVMAKWCTANISEDHAAFM
jgi:hypothetical protein